MNLPVEMVAILAPFAPLFSDRVFLHVQVLGAFAILSHGTRTVTRALRVTGLSQEKQWTNYHRVLNRASWSALLASKILLGLILTLLPLGSTVVIGADDTIERRRGRKIKHVGVYRDAVRSTKKYVVKCFGLKWVSMMVLINLPFSSRVWALPFLTVLGRPSEKEEKQKRRKRRKQRRWKKGRRLSAKPPSKRRHKSSIDLVGQMTRVVRHWLPDRAIVLVVDGAFAAVKLAHICVGSNVVMVSRLRMDASLYHKPGRQPEGCAGT